MPKIESAEELVVLAQLFHTASLQMTNCYPRVNPPVHWSPILTLPCSPNPITYLKPKYSTELLKFSETFPVTENDTSSKPVTTLVFLPLALERGTAFPCTSWPKAATELCLNSRKITQSGGCCQWLQKVQPQGHSWCSQGSPSTVPSPATTTH